MINNYLDFVKDQRRFAVQEMQKCAAQSRRDPTPWGKGFYRGHAQARSFEARHWRKLQKDIEARLADPQAAVLPLANLILTHPIFKS